jgi:N6-L-threonylcarbamoyladenine synthase
MIAYAGAQRLMAGEQNDLNFAAKARWSLEDLSAIECH